MWFKDLSGYVKALFFLGAVGVFGFLGEIAQDGGFIKSVWADLWANAKTAGPFGCLLLLILLIDERAKRDRAQQELQERTISFMESVNKRSGVIEESTRLLREMGEALRRIERRRH